LWTGTEGSERGIDRPPDLDAAFGLEVCVERFLTREELSSSLEGTGEQQ
jgi:hypothetical protein